MFKMEAKRNLYVISGLWSSFLGGDEAAFSRLYKICYRKLYSYGVSLGIDDELIRDIIQDLFLKIYEKPEIVKEVSTIIPFLLTSMKNAFFNNKKISGRFSNLEQLDDVFNLKYSVNSVESEEEDAHIKQLVNDIMQSLSPRQKEIIYLRFSHQLEYHEIATVLKISEQSARNLIHRAIKKMRKDNLSLIFLIIFSALLTGDQ